MKTSLALALILASACACAQQTAKPTDATTTSASEKMQPGATVFTEPMDGFETYLAAAIIKKKTPVTIVDDAAKAEFIVSGTSHVEKAGWAKTIFVSPAPSAGASITIKSAKTGNMTWAYAVDKFNAVRAAQSTAEACAKHLKEFIDKN